MKLRTGQRINISLAKGLARGADANYSHCCIICQVHLIGLWVLTLFALKATSPPITQWMCPEEWKGMLQERGQNRKERRAQKKVCVVTQEPLGYPGPLLPTLRTTVESVAVPWRQGTRIISSQYTDGFSSTSLVLDYPGKGEIKKPVRCWAQNCDHLHTIF